MAEEADLRSAGVTGRYDQSAPMAWDWSRLTAEERRDAPAVPIRFRTPFRNHGTASRRMTIIQRRRVSVAERMVQRRDFSNRFGNGRPRLTRGNLCRLNGDGRGDLCFACLDRKFPLSSPLALR
jgi:hypothetical protein